MAGLHIVRLYLQNVLLFPAPELGIENGPHPSNDDEREQGHVEQRRPLRVDSMLQVPCPIVHFGQCIRESSVRLIGCGTRRHALYLAVKPGTNK